jgi:hypothetical protein
MRSLTIVEAYVSAAMERARVEEQEDGTVAAYVPECKGVLAFGDDVHGCAADLYCRVEDWVRVSLERGNLLPVIGGIDLNPQARHILATYHHDPVRDSDSDFFANEQELEEALRSHDPRSTNRP